MKQNGEVKEHKILIIDDNPVNIYAIEVTLKDVNATLHRAQSGPEALALALRHRFSLILLDVQIPIMDGFETAANLRDSELNHDTSILFISAIYHDDQSILKAFSKGAIDFVIKPYDPKILAAKVRVLLEISGTHQSLLSAYEAIEQMVKARTLELEHTTQLAQRESRAKTHYINFLTHEIRTPMSSIIGVIDLLSETNLNTEQSKFLRILRDSSDNLLELVNSQLDLSQIEAGKLTLNPSPILIAEMIRKLSEMFQFKLAEKGLALKIEIDPALPPAIVADGVRLRQILINLLNNAVKFTSAGTVQLKMKQISATIPSESKISFEVADTGKGIAADKLPRLFQEFSQEDSTIHKDFGGSGLGLNISQKLVKLMGGTIHAESELGKGSRFFFKIPLVASQTPSSPVLSSPANVVQKENPPARVLIAEDNVDTRDILKLYLKNSPLVVEFAEDGVVAVEKFANYPFDLGLLDLHMPRLGGIEALTRIREIEKNRGLEKTPLIAFTASVVNEEIELCLKSGFDGILTKPVKKQELLAAIEKFRRKG